jgi:hypothetical protein
MPNGGSHAHGTWFDVCIEGARFQIGDAELAYRGAQGIDFGMCAGIAVSPGGIEAGGDYLVVLSNYRAVGGISQFSFGHRHTDVFIVVHGN